MTAGLAAVAHVALVVRHFPFASVREGRPLCSGDLSYHFAEAFEGREMIRSGLKLWAYSPYHMAGYPFGLWNNVAGSHGYMYASLLFPGASLETAYYAYLLLTALLPPFVVATAAAVRGTSRSDVLLTFIIAAVLYQADNLLSYLWTFGNVAFPFATSLTLLATALLWRAVTRPCFGTALAAGAVLGLALFLHQLVALPAALAMAAILTLSWPIWRRPRGILALTLAAITTTLWLLPWTLDLIAFRELREPRRVLGLVAHWKTLVMDFFSDRAYRHPFDRRALFHAEVVLVAWAAWRARRGGPEGRSVLVFSSVAFGLLVCAYGFSASALLRQAEPYRFVAAFTLFGILPAVPAVRHAVRLFRTADRWSREGILTIVAVLFPAFFAYAFDLLNRSPTTSLSPEAWTIVETLRTVPSDSGRVLCEDETLGNVLPALTRREVIGGQLSQTAYLPHWRSSAGRRFLFGRRSCEVHPAWLADRLDLYRITQIVACSRSLQTLVDALPAWKPRLRCGGWVLYERDGPCSVLLVGRDEGIRVKATHDRLEITGAPPGRWVLKYHDLASLQAPKGVRLFSFYDPRDPIPFLGVENQVGLPSFVIRNEWRRIRPGLFRAAVRTASNAGEEPAFEEGAREEAAP